MNLKGFHPSNFANRKRAFIAEQTKEAEDRRRKEIEAEYAKEQAIHETKGFVLQGRASTEAENRKHQMNFMYEPPPGYKKEDELKPEPSALESGKLSMNQMKALPMSEKFTFLKNAPKAAAYAKEMELSVKPFGITLKNIRCLRCKQWGHEHTERVCALFGVDILKEDEYGKEDPALLMKEMHENGLALSKRALDRTNDLSAPNQQLVPDDDVMQDPDLAFLESLTEKEKKRLFKKLDKMQKKEEKKAKKKEHKHKKHKGSESSNESDNDNDNEVWQESNAASSSPPTTTTTTTSRSSEKDEERHHNNNNDVRGRAEVKHVEESHHRGGEGRRRSRTPPRHRSPSPKRPSSPHASSARHHDSHYRHHNDHRDHEESRREGRKEERDHHSHHRHRSSHSPPRR